MPGFTANEIPSLALLCNKCEHMLSVFESKLRKRLWQSRFIRPGMISANGLKIISIKVARPILAVSVSNHCQLSASATVPMEPPNTISRRC